MTKAKQYINTSKNSFITKTRFPINLCIQTQYNAVNLHTKKLRFPQKTLRK